jgi:enoyl-[acyl-carrier protein] reductase III
MTFERASVLVTGGSRGIGKAIALRFASLGAARVAIGYMRATPRRGDRQEPRALGAEPILVRGNVASSRVADEVTALGRLDVLVHAAATGVMRPALETDDKHWDWTLSANARAPLAHKAAAPAMSAALDRRDLEPRLGSCPRQLHARSASKAALEALVRYLAVELAPRGIRVNAVSAGVVDTDALEHFPNKDAMLEMGIRNPVGRLVTREDVAAVVTFLCSHEAEMIRGQTVVVDGGWSLLANGATGA